MDSILSEISTSGILQSFFYLNDKVQIELPQHFLVGPYEQRFILRILCDLRSIFKGQHCIFARYLISKRLICPQERTSIYFISLYRLPALLRFPQSVYILLCTGAIHSNCGMCSDTKWLLYLHAAQHPNNIRMRKPPEVRCALMKCSFILFRPRGVLLVVNSWLMMSPDCGWVNELINLSGRPYSRGTERGGPPASVTAFIINVT